VADNAFSPWTNAGSTLATFSFHAIRVHMRVSFVKCWTSSAHTSSPPFSPSSLQTPNAMKPHLDNARNLTWGQLRLGMVGGLLAPRFLDLPHRNVRGCLPSEFALRKPPSSAFQRYPPATGTVQHGPASPMAPLHQAACRLHRRPAQVLLHLSLHHWLPPLRLQRRNAAFFAPALTTWNDP
jgi:hypothetical protein